MPARLGGERVEVYQFTETSGSVDAFIRALGRTRRDFRGAFGVAQSDANVLTVVGAYRVRGAATGRLVAAALESGLVGNRADLQTAPARVAGKDVTRSVDRNEPDVTTYLYPFGDILFTVRTSDRGVATEALEKLP